MSNGRNMSWPGAFVLPHLQFVGHKRPNLASHSLKSSNIPVKKKSSISLFPSLINYHRNNQKINSLQDFVPKRGLDEGPEELKVQA